MSAKDVNADAPERAAFIAELVTMVEGMIPDERVAQFDADKWVARWLDQPQPALGGNPPRAFLDTANGRGIVRRLLAKMESGAYA